MSKPTSSLKENLEIKYKKYLDLYAKDKKSFDKSLVALLGDLSLDMEIHWDITDIRYGTVMTEKQWKNFSEHSQRTRYEAKALSLFKTLEGKFNFVVTLLKDVYPYYLDLEESTLKSLLKSSISTLLDCSIEGRYSLDKIRFADAYIGRSARERDNGEINPTLVSSSILDYAIKEYAYFSNKDHKKLKEKIYSICNGRTDLLLEYDLTCDMPEDFREDIRKIKHVLSRDYTLSFFKIKLGWEIWKIVRSIGMNVDTFLDLIDFPTAKVVKEKLLAFQSDKKFVEEVLNHMKDELPQSYKKYKKLGFLFIHELFNEEAKRKKYPKKLRDISKIKEMIKCCEDEVFSYFPLARKASPRYIIMNPTHPASLIRAFQSSTRNVKNLPINVIVMTPRINHEDEYLPTLAHETAHRIHRVIDEMGEKSKVLEKDASKRIPVSITEEFSQLVESQFYNDHNLFYKKKFKGKFFPNFKSAYVQRFQVPYALVQLGIREKFDKLWDEGFVGDITPEMIWDLKTEFDKKVQKWMGTGINFVWEGAFNSLDLFSSANLDDGLVYMKRYVADEEESLDKNEENKSMSLKDAFEKRFGRKWLKSKDARIILLWLFLESGRNYKVENYYKLALSKDSQECFEELKLIGIRDKDI